MIPLADRVLLQLSWTDATNIAGGWHDDADLDEWAANGAWVCSNTGWLVHEDEHCYVLAGRMTDDGQNVGLIERIPKSAVTAKLVLHTMATRDHAGFEVGSEHVKVRPGD